jgi:hypothetical protein
MPVTVALNKARSTRRAERTGITEGMATFLHTLTGLEAARKCVCQFYVQYSMTVMCNKLENQLYRELKKKRST